MTQAILRIVLDVRQPMAYLALPPALELARELGTRASILPFEGRALRLAAGSTVDTLELAGTLTTLGYLRVPRVSLRGEFALRGEVVDIYPYGG